MHLRGAVTQDPEGITLLQEPEGRMRRLALDRASEPLRFLDGHGVTLDGKSRGRTVFVEDWQVTEGVRGLQVWVGPVVLAGEDVGIADRASKATYYVDEDTAGALSPWAGRTVLIEGYVEGALRVQVVTYRPLFPEPVP